MSTITTFQFPVTDDTVRIYTDEKGEPWFVAKEVALILGYSSPKSAVRDHCKHPVLLKGADSAPLTSSPRGINVIPEGDVYRLITKSTLESAKKFEEWMMDTVMPSIRKRGGYVLGQEKIVTGEMSRQEFMARALVMADETLKDLTAERDALLAENKKLAPKAQKYSDFLDTDGLTNLTGAAKAMDMTAIALGRRLREIGWLNKKANGVIPNDPIVKKGYMRTRIVPVNETKTVVQGRFTSEGLDALFNLFGKVA